MNISTLKGYGLAAMLALGLLTAHSASAQTASCNYVVTNSWGGGATAAIEITNTGSSALNGWSVSWSYNNNSLAGSWNANVSGTSPYTATNLDWNRSIQPGQTVSFGLQVNANGPIETPVVAGAVCGSAASSSSSSSSSFSSSSSTSSTSSSLPNPGGLTSVELTQIMGAGWNLGNSLDAVGGETNWGNPLVTRQLIDAVKAAGFDTIRIPVAWSQFSDAQNFVIATSWMNRVEQVVNYALDADMYVIMNIHWDGGWMQPTYAQQNYVNNRLAIMWTQIANRFRDHDDRLLFAGTNEVMVDGDYGTPTVEYYTVQNSFNQTFVDTVRATGGRNATRHLVVQGFNTNIDHTVNFAVIPTDTVSNRLMMEVHYYDPYNFTLNSSSNITQWGAIATNPNATETWANESYTDAQFQKMKTTFIDQGIGVILGEYGVISRLNVSDHEVYRVYWNRYITESALARGLVPVYWDNGYAGDGGFAVFDRHSGNVINQPLIDALVNSGN